jgi:ElaB/YqjD/DUF883 family membrane-anchored ribosome-binding protein
MSDDQKVPFWRRAAQQISNQAQELGSNAQQIAGTMKQNVGEAQSAVVNLTEQAAHIAQQTMSATSDSLSHLTEQTSTVIQTVAQSANHNLQTLQEDTKRAAQAAQDLASQRARQAAQHVDGAIRSASDNVADQIDRVTGERGEVVSGFVRDGGLVSIAGLAFRPIALAQRGIDSYNAYHQFMRGEITLGVCLLNLISPSIVDTQTYLKDPQNQGELLETLHKVIPADTLQKMFGSASYVGEQVSQTVKGGELSGEALQRFNDLMSYRRFQTDDHKDQDLFDQEHTEG